MTQKLKVLTIDSSRENTKRLLAKKGYIINNLQPETIIALDSAGRSCTNTATFNRINISKTIELIEYADIVINDWHLIEVRRDICDKLKGEITEEIVQTGLREFTLSLFNMYLSKLDAKEKAIVAISIYSV